MTLFFGVDGGQTSTKCVLVDGQGRVLGAGSGGALTHLAAQGSRERHVRAMREAFAAAFAEAGLPYQAVDAVGLGLTGVSTDTSREADVVRGYLPEVIEARSVAVDSDAYAALVGAHAGAAGVIAIAGTGSNVMGVNDQGALAHAGGWGWLIGDEGSAMRIGRDGVLAAVRAWDSVGPATSLLDGIRDRLEVTDMSGLKGMVYASDFGAKGFAALAAVVSECAAGGDAVARHIVETNGRELAEQVNAVVRALSAGAAAELPVAPIGGAFAHVHGLRAAFEAALVDMRTNCRVIEPRLPPMFGAAIMAFRASGRAAPPFATSR